MIFFTVLCPPRGLKDKGLAHNSVVHERVRCWGVVRRLVAALFYSESRQLVGKVYVRPGRMSYYLAIYYGASEASVVFRRLTEISEYERPAGRGHPLQGSYLSNHLADLHVVFFCRVASPVLPTMY